MWASPRIGLKPLAQLCYRAGTALQAGVDAREVWSREAERGSTRQRHHVDRIRRTVNAGGTVTEGLEQCDDYFPELVRELVDVGEKTGHVDDVLLRLAAHYDHLSQLRRIFLAGIAWPAIQFAAAVVIVGLLIWLMGLVGQMTGQPADILGLGLVGTRGLVIYLAIVGSLAAVGAALVRSLLQGRFWIEPVMRLVMRIPVLGPAVGTMALARMAWSLALAIDAGMDARQAMRAAFKGTRNAYFTRHAADVDRALARGTEMHAALRDTGAFPPELLDALEVGEKSGRLSESLAHLSGQYQQRAKTASAALTALATFATWGLVALILIALIFRVAMFYINTIYSVLDGI